MQRNKYLEVIIYDRHRSQDDPDPPAWQGPACEIAERHGLKREHIRCRATADWFPFALQFRGEYQCERPVMSDPVLFFCFVTEDCGCSSHGGRETYGLYFVTNVGPSHRVVTGRDE